MTFDITGYLKMLTTKTDEYMLSVLEDITNKNPNFIKSLKEDKTLFNEDGTPKMDMTKEEIDEKISAIISDADFKTHEVDKASLYKSFVVTKEDVDKFIIE